MSGMRNRGVSLFRRKDGFIPLDQLRTLDKLLLVRRLGAVDARTLSVTLAALREMFEA